MKNLSSLNIASNQITKLSDDFGLPKLAQLYAANNQFTTIPDSFTGMTSLSYVDFQNGAVVNLGKFLPKAQMACYYWMCGYNANKTILLNNNKLIQLPDNIGEMGIRTISLQYNELTSLPESFGNIGTYY